MDGITIAELKRDTSENPREGSLTAQLQQRREKTTRKGDPYLELTLVDGTSSFTLKAWSNHPQFSEVNKLEAGALVAVTGHWTQNRYGIDSEDWRMRNLNDREIEDFLAGDPETREKQRADWDHIVDTCATLGDPRLRALARMFLERHEELFRRAAAARRNHHARRGGLVEHVAQMMRCAAAVCSVYPGLNTDLILAGVLFHDCGKLWENNYPETGFAQDVSLDGEMMGHIPLGIQVVNNLWRELLDTGKAGAWRELAPSNERVRLHLLHLILSHHGELAFGSPTLPRTPEAFVLHYVDNLDAKFEMLSAAYLSAGELAPDVYDRQFPLPANLVTPLAPFKGVDLPPAADDEHPEQQPGLL